MKKLAKPRFAIRRLTCMNYLPLLLLLSCSIDRTTPFLSSKEDQLLSTFRSMDQKHRLKITDDREPGTPLKLCLTIVDKADGTPLLNQRMHFYHTDTSGEYDPARSGDESTARLNGSAITDNQGRIFVETILPGDYGSSADNRHIHTTVFGARPEAYDIHFKQYTGGMGRRFVEGSDQHFLADLRKSADGSLVSFLTIEVKNPGQNPASN